MFPCLSNSIKKNKNSVHSHILREEHQIKYTCNKYQHKSFKSIIVIGIIQIVCVIMRTLLHFIARLWPWRIIVSRIVVIQVSVALSTAAHLSIEVLPSSLKCLGPHRVHTHLPGILLAMQSHRNLILHVVPGVVVIQKLQVVVVLVVIILVVAIWTQTTIIRIGFFKKYKIP